MINRLSFRILAITALIAVGASVAHTPVARAAAPARIQSLSDAIDAVNHAQRSITVSAYTLSPRQAFLHALQSAAARGVHVHLVLTGDGMGYALRQNRDIASSPQGLRVDLLQRPIHLKALVVDGGAVVMLDDENFSRCGRVVALDPSFAVPVERAAIGDPHEDLPLTVTKGRSLAFEAALINQARRNVVLETESFDGYNVVARAIRAAMSRGVHVTLTVAAREAYSNGEERTTLDALHSVGATVHFQHGTQKGAIIDGEVGWIGSSNATSGVQDQIDWGYASDDPQFVTTLSQDLAHSTC